MTTAPFAQEFWRLPGPQAFLSDVGNTLRENDWLQQVIVAVPRSPEFSILAAQMANLTSPRSVTEVQLDPQDDDGVAAEILKAAGLPLPDDVPGVKDIVGGTCGQRLFIVDALGATPLQLEDLAEIIKATAAAAHNASAHLEHVQIAAIMPGEECARIDRGPRLSTQWWWGRLSRLDTLMLLRGYARKSVGPDIRTAAIVEIAAFDLALGAYLVEEWDGDTDTLAGVVLEYASNRPDLLEHRPPEHAAPVGRPNVNLTRAWSQGACDLWDDGVVVSHASALAKHNPELLAIRVWRAQAAVLLPRLEEERQRVVTWLEGQGHGPRLREVAGDPAEIGNVWFYMKNMAGMASRPQMPLVTWLRDTRNAVAHVKCVSQKEIEEGLELIARTDL